MMGNDMERNDMERNDIERIDMERNLEQGYGCS